MGISDKSNELGSCDRDGNRFLDLLTQGHLHPEDYKVVTLAASTFVMIVATLIVIRSLKRCRNENHSKFVTQSTKKLNCPIFNDQLEDLSIKTINQFDKSSNSTSTVTWDKLVRELHYAADKCYISKYANRCIQLAYYYPQLINTKFGSTGLTPFHRVCFHGQALLMKMMLKMGANPRLTTDAGENSICLAYYYYLYKLNDEKMENMVCLHILHRVGCRLEENSVWYNLLLQMAVRARKKGLVEWLLINKKNRRANQFERSMSDPLSSNSRSNIIKYH